jgi:hypothetical protein
MKLSLGRKLWWMESILQTPLGEEEAEVGEVEEVGAEGGVIEVVLAAVLTYTK